MALLGRLLLFVLIALAVLAGVGWYFLNDTERLKPGLEAEIKTRTGLDVTFSGPIAWRLTPPITLVMNDVEIADGDRSGRIEEAVFYLAPPAVWNDVRQWDLRSIRLSGAQFREDLDAQPILLRRLHVTEITDRAALIDAEGHIEAKDAEAAPMRFSIRGRAQAVTLAQGRRVIFEQTDIEIEDEDRRLVGRCDTHVTRLDEPMYPAPAATAEDLLPLALLARHEAIADCAFSEVTLENATFQDVSTKITLVDGRLNVHTEAKDIFRGSAIVEVDVNLKSRPIQWTIYPELDGVDSQALLEWRGTHSAWQGAFVAQSETRFNGNTRARLYETIRGTHEFDSMAGTIDIAPLKAQLLEAAALLGETERVAAWPDTWHYERFDARWQTDGAKQRGDIVIDNVRIEVEGDVDYAGANGDFLTHLTVGPPIASSPIQVGSLLENTRVPMRCGGPLDDLECKIDSKAAQALVSRALQGDDDSGLRQKLEQKIDEEVPEEYRDAARSILDLLGRALEGSN